jgi:hypothetical protein
MLPLLCRRFCSEQFERRHTELAAAASKHGDMRARYASTAQALRASISLAADVRASAIANAPGRQSRMYKAAPVMEEFKTRRSMRVARKHTPTNDGDGDDADGSVSSVHSDSDVRPATAAGAGPFALPLGAAWARRIVGP